MKSVIKNNCEYTSAYWYLMSYNECEISLNVAFSNAVEDVVDSACL